MPVYDPVPVIDASLNELRFISKLLKEHEDAPKTVLIGGWAVHSYNAWYGSIDIDLITDAKGKKRLEHHLVVERGFERWRNDGDQRSIRKIVSPNQNIIIDFGTRNRPDPFEGRPENLNYGLLDGRVESREVAPGAILTVPERSLLLTLKLKASWDRGYRLMQGISHDRGWETGKLLKDRGDVLALLDPEKGGRGVRLDRLAYDLQQWPFLRQCLIDALTDPEAMRFYGRMDEGRLRELRETMTGLLG